MRRAAGVIVGLAVLLSAGYGWVRAQEPVEPPVPVALRLVQEAPGQYRLEVRSEGGIEPYEVSYLVSSIGSDQAAGAQIGTGDEPEASFPLELPLDEMRGPGCYRVNFELRTLAGKPGTGERLSGIETFACLDEQGLTTFPGHDDVTSPPPPPPSDVRVVRDGATYTIRWRDNSADEIAFKASIVLLDRPFGEDEVALTSIQLPLVPANNTFISSVGDFFVPSEPAERRCGSALVLVTAIGPDRESLLPGSTTVPACFSRGEISFPVTGLRSGNNPSSPMVPAALAAVTLGLAFAAAGLRRLRTR